MDNKSGTDDINNGSKEEIERNSKKQAEEIKMINHQIY